MKLILKPNANSASKSRTTGRISHDMIDLCDSDGTMWGSIHIDIFWVEDDPDWRHDVCDALNRGREVTVDVTLAEKK